MNHTVITRQELLKAAEKIVKNKDIESLNIRSVATHCGVSVGSIYNYFNSKEDLIFALIEKFWKDIFQEFMQVKNDENVNFVNFIDDFYVRFYHGMEEFNINFLSRISDMNNEEKQKGRETEKKNIEHIKDKFIFCLENDRDIKKDLWNPKYTKAQFVDFVFENILSNLKMKNKSCEFLIETIKHIIY